VGCAKRVIVWLVPPQLVLALDVLLVIALMVLEFALIMLVVLAVLGST